MFWNIFAVAFKTKSRVFRSNPLEDTIKLPASNTLKVKSSLLLTLDNYFLTKQAPFIKSISSYYQQTKMIMLPKKLIYAFKQDKRSVYR